MLDEHDKNTKYELAEAKNGKKVGLAVEKKAPPNDHSGKELEHSFKNALPQVRMWSW